MDGPRWAAIDRDASAARLKVVSGLPFRLRFEVAWCSLSVRSVIDTASLLIARILFRGSIDMRPMQRGYVGQARSPPHTTHNSAGPRKGRKA